MRLSLAMENKSIVYFKVFLFEKSFITTHTALNLKKEYFQQTLMMSVKKDYNDSTLLMAFVYLEMNNYDNCLKYAKEALE
jgi:hypothetical protein